MFTYKSSLKVLASPRPEDEKIVLLVGKPTWGVDGEGFRDKDGRQRLWTKKEIHERLEKEHIPVYDTDEPGFKDIYVDKFLPVEIVYNPENLPAALRFKKKYPDSELIPYDDFYVEQEWDYLPPPPLKGKELEMYEKHLDQLSERNLNNLQWNIPSDWDNWEYKTAVGYVNNGMTVYHTIRRNSYGGKLAELYNQIKNNPPRNETELKELVLKQGFEHKDDPSYFYSDGFLAWQIKEFVNASLSMPACLDFVKRTLTTLEKRSDFITEHNLWLIHRSRSVVKGSFLLSYNMGKEIYVVPGVKVARNSWFHIQNSTLDSGWEKTGMTPYVDSLDSKWWLSEPVLSQDSPSSFAKDDEAWANLRQQLGVKLRQLDELSYDVTSKQWYAVILDYDENHNLTKTKYVFDENNKTWVKSE